MSISLIMAKAGGTVAISEASKKTSKFVKPRAVSSWKYNGIPEWHMALVALKAGVPVEEIIAANAALKRAKQRRRGKGPLAVSAAA